MLSAALAAGVAHSSVLQDCGQQEKTASGYDSCIVAAQQRSLRALRLIDSAITAKFQSNTKDKHAFRQYATTESHYVRERKARCGAAASEAAKNRMDRQQAQLVCEAEANFAHVAQLTQRYPQ
ncbi:hypothetical protein ACFS07_29335 [Undibacterium arcticum]